MGAPLRTLGRADVARLCLLLALAACQREPRPPAHGRVRPHGAVTLKGASLDYVRVEPAGRPSATVERPLLARVGFDERRLAVIGTPVSGRVTAVNVVTGSSVEAGQALLTIHSADVAAARSEVAQ